METNQRSTQAGRGVVLCDIDGTLTPMNVQVAFLKYLRAHGFISWKDLTRILFAYGLFLVGATRDIHQVFERASLLFQNRRVSDLQELIDEFMHSPGVKIYADARAVLEEHRRAGRKIVLLTSMVHPLARAIANRVGADDFLATNLEIQSGAYTGHIARDVMYGENKVRAATDFLAREGILWGNVWSYADTSSDIPLLRKSGHPFAVNPSKKLRKNAGHYGYPVLHFKR